MVTRATNPDIGNMVKILVEMSSAFGVKQTNSANFRLFQSTKYKSRNALFKDSTTQLVEIPSKTYKGYLGDDYVKAYEALKSCKSSPPDGNRGKI